MKTVLQLFCLGVCSILFTSSAWAVTHIATNIDIATGVAELTGSDYNQFDFTFADVQNAITPVVPNGMTLQLSEISILKRIDYDDWTHSGGVTGTLYVLNDDNTTGDVLGTSGSVTVANDNDVTVTLSDGTVSGKWQTFTFATSITITKDRKCRLILSSERASAIALVSDDTTTTIKAIKGEYVHASPLIRLKAETGPYVMAENAWVQESAQSTGWTNLTLDDLAKMEFTGTMGGKWVGDNGKETYAARGYHIQTTDTTVKMQMQATDTKSSHVKCVNLEFTVDGNDVKVKAASTNYASTTGDNAVSEGDDLKDKNSGSTIATTAGDVENADYDGYGIFGLTTIPAVAHVSSNGSNYAKLSVAVEMAASGDTITLLADCAETVTIPAGVTLDVGTYRPTGALTFEDTAQLSVTLPENVTEMIVPAYSGLALNNLVVQNSDGTPVTDYYVSSYSSEHFISTVEKYTFGVDTWMTETKSATWKKHTATGLTSAVTQVSDLAKMEFTGRLGGNWVQADGVYLGRGFYLSTDSTSLALQMQCYDTGDNGYIKVLPITLTCTTDGVVTATAADKAGNYSANSNGESALGTQKCTTWNASVATDKDNTGGYGFYNIVVTPASAMTLISDNAIHSTYASFSDAVAGVGEGYTVKLLSDVTIDATQAEGIEAKHLTVSVDSGTGTITVAEGVSIKVEIANDATITKLGAGELKVAAGVGTINLSEGTLGIIVTEESLSAVQTINNLTGATSENIKVYMPNGTAEITGITVTDNVITIPAQTTQTITITDDNTVWDSAITSGIVEVDYTAITADQTLTVPTGVSLAETKFKGPADGKTLTVVLEGDASLGVLDLESGKVTLPVTTVNAHGAVLTIPTDGELGIVMNGDATLEESVVLSGEGALAITGEGTLTIAHENTYAGGTTIASGATVKAASLTQLGGSGKAVTVDGTLEFTSTGNVDEGVNTDLSRITGTGTIKYSGSGWRRLPITEANRFPKTLALENEQADGLILSEEGTAENPATMTFGTLSGSKPFRLDWGNRNAKSRILRIEQSANSIYSGVMIKNTTDYEGATWTRIKAVCVAGATGVAANETLTLSGTTEVALPLVVEETGSVKLTGTWSGDIAVEGALEIQATEAKTIAGVVTGAGTITITGVGGVTLSNVEGFTCTIVAEVKIGDAYYETLSAALTAATAEDTVTVLESLSLDTLDLSSGAKLAFASDSVVLEVGELILGTNRDFMGDLSKSQLVVTGSVQMTEGPTEGSPIEVTWTMDNTVPVTMTMLNGGTITTDPAQGGGFTVDDDGNLVFVTTLTGKGCWYEWTFDDATIGNRLASSGRNATALGPATISNDDKNYVTTEKGYALKLSAQALQDHLNYSESLEAPNWSSSFFARMPSNEGGVLVSFGSAPRTEKGSLALVRGKSENQVVLVYIREGNSTCEVLADMKVPHAETDYHLYSFVKYGDDPEDATDNPRIEIFLDDRLWTTVQGDYAVSTGIKMGGLYYYQWSGGSQEELGTYTADVNGGRITLVGAADITDDTTTEDVDETDTTPGAIDMLRIYDCYLELAEVKRIANEYMYESPYGDFTRTISTGTANWNDADTWTKTLEDATSSVAYPTDGVATLTATVATTVTVNMTEAAELEGLTLKGSELTLSAGTETKHITVTGSTQIDTNVNVDCQAISLEGPVEIASGKTLTLTLSDTLLTKWGAEYIVNGLAVTKSLTGYVTMGAAATVDVVAPSWTETTDEQGVITFTKDNFILTVKLDTTTNCWTATLDHKAWTVTIATDGTEAWKLGDATYNPTEIDPDTVFLEGATISVVASADAELTLNGTTKGMTITKGNDATGDVTVTLQTPTDKTFNYLQLNDLIVGEGVTVVLAGDVRITKKPTMDTTSIIHLGDGTEAPESSPLPAAYFPDNGTVAYNYTDGSTLTDLSGACNLHVMTGALTLNGNIAYTGDITIDSGAEMTLLPTSAWTFNGTVTNNGTLNTAGNITLSNGANKTDGVLNVNSGCLTMKANPNLGDGFKGTMTIASGAELKPQGDYSMSVNGGEINIYGTLTVDCIWTVDPSVTWNVYPGAVLQSTEKKTEKRLNVNNGGTFNVLPNDDTTTGTVTLKAYHTGSPTYSIANDMSVKVDGAVYTAGTTVTANTAVTNGTGTFELYADSGNADDIADADYYTIVGTALVRVTGTYNYGFGSLCNTLHNPLEVVSGGTLNMIIGSDNNEASRNLQLPSLTVNGTIVKTAGNSNVTFTIASGNIVKGSGSISNGIDMNFASGAILDATNAALTVAGAVTADEDLTIKVAEGATAGTTVLTVGSCTKTHFANVVKADGTAAGLYATLDGTALTLVAKPTVPNAEGGALANTTQAVQDRIAYEALTEGKTTVTTVVVDSATGTKKHQVVDAVEFFDNILEVTGEAEAATATVKYDFGITRMTILRNDQGASEVVLTVKVQNADTTGLAPATFAEGTGLAVYIGTQKLEGVAIGTTDLSTRTVRIPYEGNTLFNAIGTYPITVRAVKEYEGSADTVAFVIDAHTSSMPVLASEVEEVALLAFTQTGSIDALSPEERTSFSVTLEGDRVDADPAAYTLTVDGVAATLVEEATPAMTTFGVSTTSSVTLNFTGFTLRKGSVVTLTTATENVGSSIAITENSWSDTFNGTQSFPFTTMVANTLDADGLVDPALVGDGKVWASYSVGVTNRSLIYRIPAMASNGAKEIVVAFDARYGAGDLGDDKYAGIDLGGSHSTDGGATWEAVYRAVDVVNFRDEKGKWYNPTTQKNDIDDITEANRSSITAEMDIGDSTMLYAPAYTDDSGNEHPGQYWLMAITGAGIVGADWEKMDCVLYTRAAGDATSWGNRRSVKEEIFTSLAGLYVDVEGDSVEKRAILSGPGHGFVTSQGWLVFPMQYFPVDNTTNARWFAAISKDNGQTWTATKLSTSPSSGSNAQENCIAELDDGSWLMICKGGTWGSGAGTRLFYRTTDYVNWTQAREPITGIIHVQGSMLKIGTGTDGRSRYVMAHQLGPDVRKKLVLIFGRDVTADGNSAGIEWDLANPVMIHEAETAAEGYNSMCMLDTDEDGYQETLGLLYESNHHIYFERIDIRPYLNVVP